MKEKRNIIETALVMEGPDFPWFLKMSFRAANAIYKRYKSRGMDEFDASLIVFSLWFVVIGSAITVVAAGLLSLIVIIVRLAI